MAWEQRGSLKETCRENNCSRVTQWRHSIKLIKCQADLSPGDPVVVSPVLKSLLSEDTFFDETYPNRKISSQLPLKQKFL